MKKLKSITLIIFLLLIALPMREVSALSGNVSISGPSSLNAGETGTYTISFTADETAYFSYNVTSDNLSLSGSTSNDVFGTGESKRESLVIRATAGSAGTSTGIYVEGSAASTVDGTEIPISSSLGISVLKPSTNNGGGGSTSGGSSSGGGSTSGGSSSDDTSGGYYEETPSLTPEEIEEQKKAQEEAEAEAKKEKEEAELEAKKKTPLFSEIDVISTSEKLDGESLTKITSEKDIFDYSYTLPKRIDSFKLELKALEGATLTYDKEHTIEEGKESIVVPVKAVSGDVTQDFKITIYKNKHVAAKLKVGNVELDAYDDELLDKVMIDSGFEKMALEVGEIKAPIYYKGEMRLMLLVDGEKADWYSLDKDSKPEYKGVLYLDKDKNPLFIIEADEETAANKLYQNAYSEKTMKINEELLAVDSKLDFNNKYKSWKYDDKREVVYGFDKTGIKDFYVFGDDSIKAAVVAFDSVDQTYKKITWGLGVVMFSSLGTGLLFAMSKKKSSKKEEDYISKEDTVE